MGFPGNGPACAKECVGMCEEEQGAKGLARDHKRQTVIRNSAQGMRTRRQDT